MWETRIWLFAGGMPDQASKYIIWVHYVIKIVLIIFTEISRCQLCSTLHHILTRETDPSPQAYLRL